MPAPSIPRNLVAQQGNGEVWLTWDTISGATSYLIQRSTDNITYSALATVSVPQYLDSGVTVDTEYWYKVASDNGLTSAYSAPVSVVPVLSGKMTLGQLRALSQQKADRVNSNFVTAAEWNTYINQSYFELYDLLVQKYGNEYFVAEPLFIATTGSDTYDLPNGINNSGAPAFYKLMGVDLALNQASNAYITLQKFDFIARNRFVYPQITTNLLGVAGLRYRLLGDKLKLIPTPQAGQQLRLWYIPRMTMLLKDTDVCDGVSGWTEYIAIDAAIKALLKEESDVTGLAMQKQAIIDRIEAAAENRDAGAPDTISDTRRNTNLYGNGGIGDGPFGGY
jgi:hypothetical protein